MTQKSERELERKLEELECRQEAHTDAALLVAPDATFPDELLPDVSTEGIRATNAQTDHREVVVPYHRPDEWWTGGLPVVAVSHVAAVWRNMDDDQLAKERALREEHDDSVPPFLEARTCA